MMTMTIDCVYIMLRLPKNKTERTSLNLLLTLLILTIKNSCLLLLVQCHKPNQTKPLLIITAAVICLYPGYTIVTADSLLLLLLLNYIYLL